VQQPRLAHAGLAGHDGEAGCVVAHRAQQQALERAQLIATPDERRGEAPPRVLGQAAGRRERLPHAERLDLALDAHRLQRSESEERPGRPVRGLADDDAAGRRDALEARGRVRHVAGDVAADLRPLAERHDGLSGLDPDPRRECELGMLVVQRVDRLLDPQGRADRAFGVVLVRDRRPEDREHAVAEELGHPSAVALDLALDPRVERPERALHLLRIGAVRPRREADEVAEQHGDEPPLLRTRGLHGAERRAAVEAEPRSGGIRLTADRASTHRAEPSERASDEVPSAGPASHRIRRSFGALAECVDRRRSRQPFEASAALCRGYDSVREIPSGMGGSGFLTVNRRGVAQARKLIKAKRYVLNSNWGDVQPKAADENAFLKEHTWQEYEGWFLGLTRGAADETKARHAFVYGRHRRLPT
jgi:hypothetical protein